MTNVPSSRNGPKSSLMSSLFGSVVPNSKQRLKTGTTVRSRPRSAPTTLLPTTRRTRVKPVLPVENLTKANASVRSRTNPSVSFQHLMTHPNIASIYLSFMRQKNRKMYRQTSKYGKLGTNQYRDLARRSLPQKLRNLPQTNKEKLERITDGLFYSARQMQLLPAIMKPVWHENPFENKYVLMQPNKATEYNQKLTRRNQQKMIKQMEKRPHNYLSVRLLKNGGLYKNEAKKLTKFLDQLRRNPKLSNEKKSKYNDMSVELENVQKHRKNVPRFLVVSKLEHPKRNDWEYVENNGTPLGENYKILGMFVNFK